ncbi:hypothetical protein [Magnetofaba australis]|nr:hypothetical protein [Magnetofaba australis]
MSIIEHDAANASPHCDAPHCPMEGRMQREIASLRNELHASLQDGANVREALENHTRQLDKMWQKMDAFMPAWMGFKGVAWMLRLVGQMLLILATVWMAIKSGIATPKG